MARMPHVPFAVWTSSVAALVAMLVATLIPMAARAAPALETVLKQRFEGDRTGACVVAALIERDTVQRARYCARSRDPVPADAAFEIGSISKTMLGLLVADQVEAGRWSLDDPVVRHLPPGTTAPQQGTRQITLRDLVTHSSGLPPLPALMRPARRDDPYATLTEAQLLESLQQATLSGPIGAQPAYSNFGAMLVSLAVARAHGGDLEAALRSRLFEPLGMRGAHVRQVPAGVPVAQGHASHGAPTARWTVAPALAGVGMVRATLDDMVRYAQALLLRPDAAMRRAMQPVAHGFGHFWALRPAGGDTLVLHEGGTGGFSSALVLQPARQRAVVLLADTALADLGGLGDVAATLLELRPAPQPPRRAAPLPASLRDALLGDYELPGGTGTLHADPRDGRLLLRTPGLGEVALLHDDRGDLYPASGFDALITPQRDGNRVSGLMLRVGGGMIESRRAGVAVTPPAARNPAWAAWAGEYALLPGFDLRVFERDGQLMVQGTGQPAIAAAVRGDDHVEIAAVGAVIRFQRDAEGRVTGLVLTQNGQTLPARRKAPPPAATAPSTSRP
jgi:CubicO group peptidase (beta-lactamase class C family)